MMRNVQHEIEDSKFDSVEKKKKNISQIRVEENESNMHLVYITQLSRF